MTAQVNDKFRFNEKDFDLVAIENEESFFDISKLGLTPTFESTDCWRGYIAIFAVDDDNNLILKYLYTNNDGKEPPIINGVEAIVVDDWYRRKYGSAGKLVYENINLPISYTGAFLIGDGFIYEHYVHMGFQHPYKYEYIEEFIFENGKCIETKNLSEEAKERREKEKTNKKESKLIDLWIDDPFDLSYTRKWWD